MPERLSIWGSILNVTPSFAGSLLSLGSILDSIFIPDARAFGGINERNSRADFERREKGLNWTRTSVRNLVIIFAKGVGEPGRAAELEECFYRMLTINRAY